MWGRRKECGRRLLILQLFGAHNKVDTPPRHFEYFARKPQKVGNEFACLASSAIMCTLCASVCVCELINRHVSVREERKMRGGGV